MVDIEAQAGTSPGASPRIKAHHGDTTEQKQQQKSTSILMTLFVIAAWCASLLFVGTTCLLSGDGVFAWCPVVNASQCFCGDDILQQGISPLSDAFGCAGLPPTLASCCSTSTCWEDMGSNTQSSSPSVTCWPASFCPRQASLPPSVLLYCTYIVVMAMSGLSIMCAGPCTARACLPAVVKFIKWHVGHL